MNKVLVKSLYDAFEYVMEHFYPYGQAEFAVRKDTYAVISIQDSYTGGIGFQFTENNFCKGVLTLLVDDKVTENEKVVLFNEDHAKKIINFIKKYYNCVDTLLIHCYGGQSRSVAVGAFVVKILGGNNSEAFEQRSPNMHIYNVLEKVWNERSESWLNDVVDYSNIEDDSVIFELSSNDQPDFEVLLTYSRMFDSDERKYLL